MTAINAPFSGTPTPLADALVSVSGEITTESSRAVSSRRGRPPARSSDPDLTTATKLDSPFVHLVPGTLVDAYEVEKLLGAGGMGAVYGARHTRLGRRAAIKVISPNLSRDRDAIERFEQEAHALARISHPNIVGVLSVGTLPDGRSYFVMEWLDGESLRARLDRRAIAFDLTLHIIDQIARGLEVAHAAGIVHRDLKPDNVWLHHVGDEPRPVVKLLDFGLAKVMQSPRSEHTESNMMFGTSAYMSPEQCRSARDVGPATDVYALGCVAYELLFARLPFTYDNMAELVAAHLREEPPKPTSLDASIDPSLDTLLSAMLAKDPLDRPRLARVRDVIANALGKTHRANALQPVVLRPDRPRPATPATMIVKPQPSRRVFLMLTGLVLMGCVIAAAVGGSGPAPLDHPTRIIDASKSAVDVNTTFTPSMPSVAPTGSSIPTPAVVDAKPSVAVPPPPRVVDAPPTRRPNVERRVAPVARDHVDAKAPGSESTVVVEHEREVIPDEVALADAADQRDGEAPASPQVDVAAIEQVDAAVGTTAPNPPVRRPSQRPTTTKRSNRYEIINPYKKRK
jgi:serine/threonine protein kinase